MRSGQEVTLVDFSISPTPRLCKATRIIKNNYLFVRVYNYFLKNYVSKIIRYFNNKHN